jgi:hypothetical protein
MLNDFHSLSIHRTLLTNSTAQAAGAPSNPCSNAPNKLPAVPAPNPAIGTAAVHAAANGRQLPSTGICANSTPNANHAAVCSIPGIACSNGSVSRLTAVPASHLSFIPLHDPFCSADLSPL